MVDGFPVSHIMWCINYYHHHAMDWHYSAAYSNCYSEFPLIGGLIELCHPTNRRKRMPHNDAIKGGQFSSNRITICTQYSYRMEVSWATKTNHHPPTRLVGKMWNWRNFQPLLVVDTLQDVKLFITSRIGHYSYSKVTHYLLSPCLVDCKTRSFYWMQFA